MPGEKDEINELLGSTVVVDTATSYVYIGMLKEWHEHFIVLSDADVHDVSESRTVKDVYILEARRDGVRKNRRRVFVSRSGVVSISALEDVIPF